MIFMYDLYAFIPNMLFWTTLFSICLSVFYKYIKMLLYKTYESIMCIVRLCFAKAVFDPWSKQQKEVSQYYQ